MAIKISTVDESIIDNGVKALVYGPPGAGKTRLAATAASPESPVILISAEAGLLSLQDIPKEQKENIQVVNITTFGELGEVYELLSKEHSYAWVCLDSISEIAEVILADEKARAKDPRQAYGALADSMMATLRAFRDLPKYNVYMSAKMVRFTDEISQRTYFMPSMPGKQLTNNIGFLFDEVFALRVEATPEGELSRWLQTGKDVQYECKDRSGRLDMFEAPDLIAIERKIKGIK